MISTQSIEHNRLPVMMMNDTSTSSQTKQAVSPYTDHVMSPYSDTVEDENRTANNSMRFFDIEVEEEGQTIHDQLPSVEEVKANSYIDNLIRRKKRSNRNLALVGFLVVAFFIVVIHGKTKQNKLQSAITSITTTVRLSHKEAFLDPISPQSQALKWMLEEDSLRLQLPSSSTDPFVQRYVIAVLTFALTTPNTKTNFSHKTTRKLFRLLSGVHECDWNSDLETLRHNDEKVQIKMGIICENQNISDLSVTGISLPNSGLRGELPPELEILSHLRSFDLANNAITGTIPPMPHLRELKLARNQLTGTLPEHFSEMIHLTMLSLSENDFTGRLPSKFASVTNLRVLDLTENQLTGGFEEMYTLNNLEELYLANNSFRDDLSQTSFQELTNLRVIDAKENRLSGPLPNAFWRLTHLQVIDLHKNSLDGHINDIIAESHGLKYLDVSNNLLGGGLPSSISNLESLAHLDISYNRLDSRIPRDHMVSMTNLKTLILTEDDDMGPGPLPTWLRGMTDLEHLSFRLATRTGTIPTWFGELTKLELLDLDWNHISGTIPTELGLLTNLKYLMLNRNFLTGKVPRNSFSTFRVQSTILQRSALSQQQLVQHGHSTSCSGAASS